MGGIRSSLLGAWVGAAALCSGCFSPPSEAVARLEQVKQDGAELEKAVDGLEERFLGNQTRVLLWEELQRRHRHVSAIAVRNQNGHFEEMVRLLVEQQEKSRKLKRGSSTSGPYLSRAVPAPRRSSLNAR